MKKKGTGKLVLVLSLVLALGFVGYVAYTLFGVDQVVYSVAVADRDILPQMPVSMIVQRKMIKVPFWQTIPKPPDLLTSRGQLCANRHIPKGTVMQDSYVGECQGFVSISVALPPETNSPTLAKGDGAMICMVAEGAVARDFCSSDSCVPQTEFHKDNPMEIWELSSEIEPLEFNVPEGMICVTGILGDALNANGQPVEVCNDSSEDSRVTIGSGDITTASPAVQTEGGTLGGDENECNEEPPVSRMVIVPPASIPFFGRLEHYTEVSERMLFAGDVSLVNGTILFKVVDGEGRWFLLPDNGPWVYEGEEEVQTGEGGNIEEQSTPTPEVEVTEVVTQESDIGPVVTPTITAESTITTTTPITPTTPITRSISISESLIVTDTTGITVTVKVDNLALRSSPDGEQIGTVGLNSVITMTTFNGLLDNPWIGVIAEDGEYGWVSGEDQYIDYGDFTLEEFLPEELREPQEVGTPEGE
jgi:hypothetical protein